MTIASVVPQFCLYVIFVYGQWSDSRLFSYYDLTEERGAGDEFFLGKEGLVNRLLILINS